MRLSARVRALLVLGVLVVLGLVGATSVAVARKIRAGRPLKIERPDPVLALAFTPSGDELLSLEGDEHGPSRPMVIFAWREPTGAPAGPVTSDTNSPTDIRVSKKNVLGVAHAFGDITLYSMPHGAPLGQPLHGGGWQHSYFGHDHHAVHFSRTGARVAADGVWDSLSIWDVGRGEKLNPGQRDRFGNEDEKIQECDLFLGFASEDRVAYVSSVSVQIWSIATQSVVSEIPVTANDEYLHVLSPRGSIFVSYPWGISATHFQATLRSLPSGSPVGLPVLVEPRTRIAFSDDDELVAVVGPRRVLIQEVRTGSPVFTFSFPTEVDPTSVTFSPTRDRLAIARGKTIHVVPFRR